MVTSRSLLCFLLAFLWSFFALPQVSFAAKTRHLTWDVSYQFRSPDCLETLVMTINGKFPGPTIRANVGDTIVVNLHNKLHTEGVVIHWHGIRQLETPWADGTASISQCAINPEESFVYKFKVDKAGTYLYHGHYGMQRSAGLYGSLIVDVAEGQKEPFSYDGEVNLLLSDWWHKSVHAHEIGLSSRPFRWIGEPKSILMNGKGQYKCSLAAHVRKGMLPLCKLHADNECAPHVFHVLPNKIYRLRIASSTSLASLNVAVGHHKMLLVEADGNYVEPVVIDNIDVYSGESYSVLINTTQNPSMNYWVSATVRGRKPETQQGLTILNYLPNPPSVPTSPLPIQPEWNDYAHSKAFMNSILALPGSPKPTTHHDRLIHLLNTQTYIKGYTKWAVNNVSLALPTTPYLGSIRLGLKGAYDDHITPADNFSSDYDVMKPPTNPNSIHSSGVYMLDFNKTIDVIIQNANILEEKESDIHPWHLHGHDFWVLGYGEGRFSEAKDSSKLNLKNPPLRNTAVIFPYGWTAIRFVTDNPGVWAFHCHIEPDLHLGMGVIFAEAVERVPLKDIPIEAIACGMIAKRPITPLMDNSTGTHN